MLFVGTSDGVYRIDELPFESTNHVLAGRSIRDLRTGPDGDTVVAATDSGVYTTADGGDTWTDLESPVADVHSVLVTDRRRYAGVRPAGVYASSDGGETWSSLEGFQELATESPWPTAGALDRACVRTLAAPPGRPDALLAGVEVGGLVVSFDGGRSWQRRMAVPDDVHHVHAITADRWLVSCGTGGPAGRGGVFETTDAGETWTALETGAYTYVRESWFLEGCYTAGNRTPPFWDPPDAALFVDRPGDSLESVSYPGAPTSFVISWATVDGDVVAGTNDGWILRERRSEWVCEGRVPVSEDDRRAYGVRSLATI